MENQTGLADRARFEAFTSQWEDAVLKEAGRRCSDESVQTLLAAAVLAELRKKYARVAPPLDMEYDIREKTNAVYRVTGRNPLLLEYYLESHAFLDTPAAERAPAKPKPEPASEPEAAKPEPAPTAEAAKPEPAPEPEAAKPEPAPTAEAVPEPEVPEPEEDAAERVPDTFLDPVRTTLWTPDSERSRHVVQEIVLPDEDEEPQRSEKLSFVNAILFLLVMASFLFCFFETGFLQYLLN